MDKHVRITMILFVCLFFFGASIVVKAQWSAINSGYAVTTNYHGITVNIGSPITATAGTTNLNVLQVEFLWMDPGKNIHRDVTVSLLEVSRTTYPWPGPINDEIIQWCDSQSSTLHYKFAQDTLPGELLDEAGDWTVQAHFLNTGEKPEDRIRATSWMSIPEAPLGTITILLGMFGALSLYLTTKRKA